MKRRLASEAAAAVVAALAFAGCAGSGATKDVTATSAELAPTRSIADIVASESPTLLAIPGVVAVREGQSEGRPCIVVFVDKVMAEHRRRIPTRLQNVPVVIEASTDARALD
jgi:hypothetical protein